MALIKKIIDRTRYAVGITLLSVLFIAGADRLEKIKNAPEEAIKNARVVSVKKWIDTRYLPRAGRGGLLEEIRDANIRDIEARGGEYDYASENGFFPDYVEHRGEAGFDGYVSKEEIELDVLGDMRVVFMNAPRRLPRISEGDIGDFVVKKAWHGMNYEGLRVENLKEARWGE